MKNLIFFLGIFFFANIVYSQETYYLLQGRSEASNAVIALADAINSTNFPVEFKANEAIGDYFILSLYHNGIVIFEKRYHLSDEILADMNIHIRNPQTGESINDICIRQAQAMQQVFRRGLKLERQEITNLSNAYEYNQELRRNYERHLDNADDYMVIIEDQDWKEYSNVLGESPFVEKTWFGRNWYWVVPVALLVGYVAYDGFTPGGWFDFYRSRTTTLVIDSNNPDYPGNNPNAEAPGKVLQNIALDNISQRASGGIGGLSISF